MKTKEMNFNPLNFLASLGAGGIAVAPFVYFQYTKPHGKGLITYSELMSNQVSAFESGLQVFLMLIMVVFTVVHFVLTVKFAHDLFGWMKTRAYKELMNNPLKNASILAPFISIAMTMNIVIAVIRFFVPLVSANFQSLMLPALIGWLIIWVLLMRVEISLLKITFKKEFNINNISFGWLLHPFALAMVSVTGMGIAAMAKNHAVAHIAVVLSVILLTMGFFLFLVKLISVFTSHFNQKGIPERQFLPSFLIVIPIMTLFAISVFRFGHYLEHHFNFHFDAFFMVVILFAFAFETWYLMFGISMLKDYFKRDFFKKEYYVTLWAFICPFVAYSVLTSFLYQTFLPALAIEWVALASLFTAVAFYSYIFIRYLRFSGVRKMKVELATVKNAGTAD